MRHETVLEGHIRVSQDTVIEYGQWGAYTAVRYAKNQSVHLLDLGSGATSVPDWFLQLADEYSGLAEGNLLRICIF